MLTRSAIALRVHSTRLIRLAQIVYGHQQPIVFEGSRRPFFGYPSPSHRSSTCPPSDGLLGEFKNHIASQTHSNRLFDCSTSKGLIISPFLLHPKRGDCPRVLYVILKNEKTLPKDPSSEAGFTSADPPILKVFLSSSFLDVDRPITSCTIWPLGWTIAS